MKLRRFTATQFLALGICAWSGAGAWAAVYLSRAEWSNRNPQANMFAGNGETYKASAERDPSHASEFLRRAVAANPRDSGAWISLGLEAEGVHDFEAAAADLAAAENVDHQYLPAWTAANYFFRRYDKIRFWVAAARAARMANDDLTPLLELADRMDPASVTAVSRLGPTPRLERTYLDFLIRKQRWDDAARIAQGLLARHDPKDEARLLDLTDRLLAAGRDGDALRLCQELSGCVVPRLKTGASLANTSFLTPPSGHGFDWRVMAPVGLEVRWGNGALAFWPSGSEPDAYPLLEQPVLIRQGRYRLHFEYRVSGTGFRWVIEQKGAALQASAAYGGAEMWQDAQWSFAAVHSSWGRLQLVYDRKPGALRMRGPAGVRSLRLESL